MQKLKLKTQSFQKRNIFYALNKICTECVAENNKILIKQNLKKHK